MHFIKGLSAFKPTKFSGCALWLAADRGVTTVDGKVSAWADQSGNGKHAAQTTSNLRPTYEANGTISNRPAIRFSTDGHVLTGSSPISGNTPFTCFMVAQSSTSSPTRWSGGFWTGIDSTTAGYGLFSRNGSTGSFGPQWGSGNSESILAAAWPTASCIVSSTYDGNTHKGYLNGSSGTTVSKTNSNLTAGTYWVGRSLNLDICQFYGDISEIIIFSRALTDAERVKVEQYLSSKFAITLA